jgi:hypothetical protein
MTSGILEGQNSETAIVELQEVDASARSWSPQNRDKPLRVPERTRHAAGMAHVRVVNDN